MRCAPTMNVEPPTLPAVCTRSMGLPAPPSASARNSSGCTMPSNASGALPITTASMSAHVHSASSSARSRGLPQQPGDRDVGALLLVVRLTDADDCGTGLPWSVAFHEADQVVLQHLAAGGVGEPSAALTLRRCGGPPRRSGRVRSPSPGWRPAAPPDGLTLASASRPSASRRMSSCGLNVDDSSTTSSGPPS